ncbi:MAG: cytochrome c [Bryobacteraceae bacterium]
MAFNKSFLKSATLAAGVTAALLAIGLPMTAFAPDAKKGKATFDESCGSCHMASSTEALVGPGLKGLFKRAKLANGKALNEAAVRDLINKGGDVMPPFGDTLKPAEKDDLVAYLKTL